jgi:hypothetical protein
MIVNGQNKSSNYTRRSQTILPRTVRGGGIPHLANNEPHHVSCPIDRSRLYSENLHGSNGQNPMSRAFRKGKKERKGGGDCQSVIQLEGKAFYRVCPPDLLASDVCLRFTYLPLHTSSRLYISKQLSAQLVGSP